jgi:predicted Rossmann fold flavoprotein
VNTPSPAGDSPSTRRIVIVGGGAAGFFAAITCAETLAKSGGGQVIIHEATSQTLAKVRISGGGRCNVTNACFEPRELSRRYPRGSRELIGPLGKWGPRDTVAWFAERGVELKAEEDGRMFPVTDNSETIIDCLRGAAEQAGVQVNLGRPVLGAEHRHEGGFLLNLAGGSQLRCDRLLIATGGNAESGGMAMARSLGHTIEPPVPSLFTFKIEDPRLAGLSGLASPKAGVTVNGTKLKEEGPLLITHWGMSGPAILRLSAWGARELSRLGYRFTLRVNWVPDRNRDTVQRELAAARQANPKKQLATWCPLPVPLRLWEKLIVAAGLRTDAIWTGVSNDFLGALARQLTEAEFQVLGKAANKEEFVTCGGVRLAEVEFRTMESKVCPGLHFAGEVLDIDGITGGFNFQAAWTTGRLAGLAMAADANR